MKRNLTIRVAMAVLVAAGCTGTLSSVKGQSSRPAVDFDNIIRQKQADYLANWTVSTKADLAKFRSLMQDRTLAEFDRCPECFVRKFVGAQRTYLFDAVTDCETMVRVGTLFDGGKWLCSPQSLPPQPVVYSFGIGDDISFDMDLAALFGCEVYMFDPSPSVVRNFIHVEPGRRCGRGRLTFEPVGLGPVQK